MKFLSHFTTRKKVILKGVAKNHTSSETIIESVAVDLNTWTTHDIKVWREQTEYLKIAKYKQELHGTARKLCNRLEMALFSSPHLRNRMTVPKLS